MHSLGKGTEGFEKAVHDACRAELLCSDDSHGWSIDGVDLVDRVDEVIKSNGVRVAFHARCSGRHSVDDNAGVASAYEGSSRPDAHSGAACQQNLLESQRPVVVVS